MLEYLQNHGLFSFEATLCSGLAIASGWLLGNRRYLSTFLLSVLTALLFLYSKSFSNWMTKIGADSFVEISNFDIYEAQVYIYTLSEVFTPAVNFKLLFLALGCFIFALGATLFRCKREFLKRLSNSAILASILLIALGGYDLWTRSLSSFIQNSITVRQYQHVFSDNTERRVTLPSDDLSIVIYIGESTSSMNMGVYGYFRNTTPNLSSMQRSPGLIVFDNVSSTHTHTTPSLAEALSVPLSQDGQETTSDGSLHDGGSLIPIEEQRRISIVDILVNSGKSVFLFSNQSQAGSFSVAVSELFKRSTRAYSTNTILLGDLRPKSKPFDGDYFRGLISNCIQGSLCSGKRGQPIVFLHSYAGHMGYYDNIPPAYRQPVDQLFNSNTVNAIIGTNNRRLAVDVEKYDAAIKYIDQVVSDRIREVEQLAVPTVFLYFSDHGESPYSGRGHDSSRYVHEMSRVPMLIYFNEAARNKYSEKYNYMVALASQNNPTTLRSLPATLLFVLGAINQDDHSSNQTMLHPLIGEKQKLSPIVVRRTAQGVSAVDLMFDQSIHKRAEVILDGADAASKVYAVANARTGFQHICSHRSDTLARVRRAAIVGDCLEVDIVVSGPKKISVYHPPAQDVGLDLENIIAYAMWQNKALWLDGKNLNQTGALCDLMSSLKPYANRIKVLIELPSNSLDNIDPHYRSCADGISQLGFSLSYYAPTQASLQCARHLASGGEFEASKYCIVLSRMIGTAADSKIFSDLSFDFGGYAAISEVKSAKSLKWNTWSMPPSALKAGDIPEFRNIMLPSDKLNWN